MSAHAEMVINLIFLSHLITRSLTIVCWQQDPPPPDPPAAPGPAHPAAIAPAAASQPAANQHPEPPGSDQFICEKHSLQIGN